MSNHYDRHHNRGNGDYRTSRVAAELEKEVNTSTQENVSENIEERRTESMDTYTSGQTTTPVESQQTPDTVGNGFDAAMNKTRFDIKNQVHRLHTSSDARPQGVTIANPSIESAKNIAFVVSGSDHENDIYDYWVDVVARKFNTHIDYELTNGVVFFFVKPIMPWDVVDLASGEIVFGSGTSYENYDKAFKTLSSVFASTQLPNIQELQ